MLNIREFCRSVHRSQIWDFCGANGIFGVECRLDNGSSNVVEVSRSELGYGTFIYTLFVDGKKADTLKKYVSL